MSARLDLNNSLGTIGFNRSDRAQTGLSMRCGTHWGLGIMPAPSYATRLKESHQGGDVSIGRRDIRQACLLRHLRKQNINSHLFHNTQTLLQQDGI
jgi:hypothetical protein